MKTYRNLRNWVTLAAAIAALAFIGWVVFEVLSDTSESYPSNVPILKDSTQFLSSETPFKVPDESDNGQILYVSI